MVEAETESIQVSPTAIPFHRNFKPTHIHPSLPSSAHGRSPVSGFPFSGFVWCLCEREFVQLKFLGVKWRPWASNGTEWRAVAGENENMDPDGQASSFLWFDPASGEASLTYPTPSRWRAVGHLLLSVWSRAGFESVHYRILYVGDRCTVLFIASDRIDLIELIMLMTLYLYAHLRLLERLAGPRGSVE